MLLEIVIRTCSLGSSDISCSSGSGGVGRGSSGGSGSDSSGSSGSDSGSSGSDYIVD